MKTKTAVIKDKRIVVRNLISPFAYGASLWLYQVGSQEEDVPEFIMDNNVILEVTVEDYERFSIGDSFTYQEDTELNKYLYLVLGAVLSAIMALAFFVVTR